MKSCEVLVVGSGMAGMMAALTAAARHKSVRLITRGLGCLAIGGACVDVLGYVRGRAVTGDPLDAIEQLEPDHPYRLMGREVVAAALEAFKELCAAHGLPLRHKADRNLWLPTVLGTFRPTWLYPGPPEAPVPDRDILAGAERIVVASVESLKDCHAPLVARELGRQRRLAGKPVIPVVLPMPYGPAHRNLTPLDLARHMDTAEGRSWLIKHLEPHTAPGTAILLPPLLGVNNTRILWRELGVVLNCPLLEMQAPPPGVGGLRLRRVLLAALANAGVRLAENVRVSGADVAGRRCRCLYADAPDRRRELVAESFVLATGGFLGGGIVASPGRATEAVFGLDLNAPPEVPDWSVPDIFQPQPYARLGVRVNERLQPVDRDGNTLLENVFVAGRSLAGYDFVTEKSGNGVALASGFHAGRLC